MSGGRFSYKDSLLMDEIFGYAEKPTNAFEDWEISRLVWDVLELVHDFDWYISGDTGEDDWLKAKMRFKNKWFGRTQKARTKEIIDKVLGDAKEELYKTFGVKPGSSSDQEEGDNG